MRPKRSNFVQPCIYFQNWGWNLKAPPYSIPRLQGPDLQNGIQKAAYIILGFCIKNSVVRNTKLTALGWRLEESLLSSILAGSRELLLEPVNKERTLRMLRKSTESLIFVQKNCILSDSSSEFSFHLPSTETQTKFTVSASPPALARKSKQPSVKGQPCAIGFSSSARRSFKQTSYLRLTENPAWKGF